MHTKPSIEDPEMPFVFNKVRGDICFKDMSFGYDDNRLVLHHISLDIPAGKTIAFVGETGTGKSTLANVLLRFYDPSSGEILIDGKDIKEYCQQDLRKQIGIVQQDVFLFGDSIGENIGYGKEGASAEEIKAAAKLAAADEFISQLPHGYETKVGRTRS